MHWVNHDDLEIFVGGVLGYPVAVEYTESSQYSSGALLGNALQAPGELELVDSVSDGLTVGGSLGDWAFATSTTDTDAVYKDTYEKNCLVCVQN